MLDQTLNNLIGSIYEAALDGDLWVDVLDSVRAVTPCRVASLYSLDRIADTPTIHQVVGMDPDVEQAFLQRWGADNPITGAVAHLNPGDVRGLASILDYEAFTRTPIFQHWGRPQGYCDVINIMLERSATRLAAVSLIRGVEDGLADAPTLARLELLAPHFLRAVRIGRALEHATLREQTFERTLDVLASAVLLVGPTDCVVYANAAAQALMRGGLPLGRIAAAARPDQAFLVTLADGVRRMGHSLPLGHMGADRMVGRLHGCRVVVLKEEPAIETAITSATVLFNLTRRESDVLFALLESGGAPGISRLLGISKNTVSTHLKRLFEKTGTERQSGLVNLVSGMASPFRQPAPG